MAKSDSTRDAERAQLEQQIRDAEGRGDTAEADRLRAQVADGQQGQQGQSGQSGTSSQR